MLNHTFCRRLFYTLVSLLILAIPASAAGISKNGHKITDLSIDKSDLGNTDNGKKLNSINLSFKLLSTSDIDSKRFKITLNTTELKINRENLDKENLTINRKDLKNADITFFANTNTQNGDIPLIDGKNKIKVAYLATANPNSAVVAQLGTSFQVGTNSTTTSGNSGDKDTATKLIKLSIEEVSDEPGIVSLANKKFRLTVEHDGDLISGHSDVNNFDKSISPILSNLKIKSLRPGADSPEAAKKLFNFTLEKASENIVNGGSMQRTVFISSNMVIKEAQTFEFKIDMEEHFESIDQAIPDGSSVKDTLKFTIAAVKLNLTKLQLSGNQVLFMPYTSSNLKRQELFNRSETSLVAELSNSKHKPTDAIQRIVFNKAGKDKRNDTILRTKTQSRPNLSVKVNNKGSFIVNDLGSNNYQIDIPLNMNIESSRNFFLKNNDFISEATDKEIIMPVHIETKSSEGLDLLLSGTLTSDNKIQFLDEPRFVKTNKAKATSTGDDLAINLRISNTIGSDTNNIDAELILKDFNSAQIGQSVIISDFLNISSKSIGTKGKVKHIARVKSNLKDLKTSRVLSPSEIDQASSVEIKLKRNDSFLNSIGLSEDPLPVSKNNQVLSQPSLIINIKK